MPTKSKAVAVPTRETIEEADQNIRQAEKPSDADYKTIIAGAQGDAETRQAAALFIPRHFEKFPTLANEASDALVKLAKDESDTVRFEAVRALRHVPFDKKNVCEAIFEALDDTDSRIQVKAQEIISLHMDSTDHRAAIIKNLKNMEEELQKKVIKTIVQSAKFTEEEGEVLVDLVDSSIKVSVFDGLTLMNKVSKFLPEGKTDEYIDSLLERLQGELDKDLDAACNGILLDMLNRSKSVGDAGMKKLTKLVATKVVPRLRETPAATQIAILRKICNLTRYCEDADLLDAVFEAYVRTLPNADSEDKKINFSIVEPALAIVQSLVTKFTTAASKLIGRTIIKTGQPSELEGAADNEERNQAFRSRLQFVNSTATDFVTEIKARKEVLKQDTETPLEDKKPQFNQFRKAVATGNNVARLCRFLLDEKRPSDRVIQLSWKSNTKQTKQRPGTQRNDKKQSKRR